MADLAIYGSGGFGREVAWLAECCSTAGAPIRVVCFIDDNKRRHGAVVAGTPVLGLGDARARFPQAGVVSGIGSPRVREQTMERAKALGFDFTELVHPRVEMARSVRIGTGAVICAGTILTVDIRLGDHVQINLDCTIGHDAVLEDYATLAPGVHVSGWVRIGRRAYIGTGANIINGTESAPLVIGDGAVVGAGACVTKSVPAGTTAVGVPARVRQ